MKAFFLIFSIIPILYAANLKLKNVYPFNHSILYSKDFFPDLKEDFEVLRIPDHLTHFNVAQQRIYTLFAQHNVHLEGKPSGLVRFQRISAVDLSPIEKKIFEYYSEKLPFLIINKVTVDSKINLHTFPKNFTMELKKQAFKNHRGSVKVITEEHRYFFDYRIDATFSQFQASKTLHKGDLITADNTKLVIRPFISYHNPHISFKDLGQVRVRKYIKIGKAIHQRDVETLPLVKKGAIVNVKVIEGNILINFTATAQHDGALNDIITIKRSDGTRRKAKVVGLRKVELE